MIKVKHHTLSQKIQTATPGIISKDEWNDYHQVEQILESDVLFSSTGHNHDGTNSAFGLYTQNVYDSSKSLSSSNFVSASSVASSNQIPIIDSTNTLNIKKGTPSTSRIAFLDSSIVSSIYHDYAANVLNIKSEVSGSAIQLANSGDINIIPVLGNSLFVKGPLKSVNPRTSELSTWGVQFYKNDGTSLSSQIIHKLSATPSLDGLNIIGGGSNLISLTTDGNILISTLDSTKKAYYTKNPLIAPTANDELLTIGTPINLANWSTKTKIYEGWQHIFYNFDTYSAYISGANISCKTSGGTFNGANQTLPHHIFFCQSFTLDSGVTVLNNNNIWSPIVIIANDFILINGTLSSNGLLYGAGASGAGLGGNVTYPTPTPGEDMIWGCGAGGAGGGIHYVNPPSDPLGAKGGDSLWYSYGMGKLAGGYGSPTGPSGANVPTIMKYILMEHIKGLITSNTLFNHFNYSNSNNPANMSLGAIRMGGCGGGNGFGGNPGNYGGVGGGGGGVIILIARNSITINGTVTANGGPGSPGGTGGGAPYGGGGGGGGGAIIAISPFISTSGLSVITSNGGAGGAGGSNAYAGGKGGDGVVFLNQIPNWN